MSEIIQGLSLAHACVLTEIHREHRSAKGFLVELINSAENSLASMYLSSYDLHWITNKTERIREKVEKVDTLREVAKWIGVDKDLLNRALGDEDLVFL